MSKLKLKRGLGALAGLLALMALMGLTAGAAEFDPRAFGAAGDGRHKDTLAIQQAIDAAAAAGGGTVALGAGTYVTGTIYLKSKVELHLGPGAVLQASADPADYCAAEAVVPNWASSKTVDNTSGGHLLVAVGQQQVALTGPGKLDGNGRAFLVDAGGQRARSKAEIAWRPAQMVYVVNCSDIRIADVELADAPYWSCLLLNCDRVWVRGAYVHTSRSPHTFNGDGIDVDRCRWVTISDCRIDTADDCITLRASFGKLLAAPQDCAFVTIANCNLSSSCNGIRFGVGEGRIHDVTVTGLTVSDTRTAFNFVAAYSENSRGTDIDNVRISECTVRAKLLLHMYAGFSRQARFENLVFTGISGRVEQPADIEANHAGQFRRVCFREVEVGAGYRAKRAEVAVERGDFPCVAE